jgi:hypothetical protein
MGLEKSFRSSAHSAAVAYIESLYIWVYRSFKPSSRLMQTLSGTLDTEPLLNPMLLLDAARPSDTETKRLQETAIAEVATATIYMHARDAIAVAAMIGI